ncbi:MAG: elongation factor Ts [Candidatus Omnitrophica bacterium]|nr:elongation factor Ts [Candidatus Omnitrophota bacterium]
MVVSVDMIKELRRVSSASIGDCQKALTEAEGDFDKAIQLLRKRGLEIAAKRQGSTAKEGRVEAYLHMGNKIGVLVEVSSETDFVARNDDFIQFTKDVAMQVAACDPSYINTGEVPAEVLETAKDKEQFLKANCLLEQPFIKDPGLSIKDLLGGLVAKYKENIVIRRFVRYKIGG